MATPLDPLESERARAVVAVACLEWLRCTGPKIPPTPAPARNTSVLVAELLQQSLEDLAPIPPQPATHPLWDRWIDG